MSLSLRPGVLRSGAAWLLFLLCGCAGTYYGPISVPVAYSPERPTFEHQKEIDAELDALQHIDAKPYRISPEDRFNVQIYEYPELEAKNTVITPDGLLATPLVGAVPVGGLTLLEAQQAVADALGKLIRDPKVSLIPLEVTGYSYTISGNVNHPGRYVVSVGRTKLADAVAMAGGFVQGLYQGNTMPLADLNNAYISRNGKILPVDFNKAITEGDPRNNIPLQNGDLIYIPAMMGSRVALLGEINTQTYIGHYDGITVLTALTAAHGLKDTHSSLIKIIRGSLHDPEVYTVNVDLMLQGKIQDFPLMPDDIVYFPPDGISDWNIIVRKIMPSLQGLTMLAGPFGNPSSLIYSNN